MKKLLYTLLPLLCFAACEVIPEDERYTEPSVADRYSNRNTVLMEFTGWRCPNCPTAADIAHNLLHVFPEQMVVVELHPASNGLTAPKKDGSQDYTCPEADEYYLECGGTNVTNFPTGVINLTAQSDGSFFRGKETWVTEVFEALKTEASAEVSAKSSYDAATRTIMVNNVLINSAEQEQTLRLVCWLTQDSLIGHQSMPDGKTNKEYYHQHVLRQALTPVWGDTCCLPVATDTQHRVSAILRNGLEPVNCHIVSLLLNEKNEIVNAIQIPLDIQ